MLNAVTPEEVILMAKKYLRPDRAHILVVGRTRFGNVADRLKQFTPDGKINFYDVYGNPVKAVGAIPAGVTGQTIITDYLNAIGGTAKIATLKDVQTSAVMKSQAPNSSSILSRKAATNLPCR